MSDFLGPLTRHLDRQPGTRRKRRRHRRVPTRLPLARLTLPGGEILPVQVRNLSLMGIGLVSALPIPKGLIVQIQLINRTYIFSLSIGFEVIHCDRQNDDTFAVGGRFCRPLSSQELGPFVR
jgi:hypothetical protein